MSLVDFVIYFFAFVGILVVLARVFSACVPKRNSAVCQTQKFYLPHEFNQPPERTKPIPLNNADSVAKFVDGWGEGRHHLTVTLDTGFTDIKDPETGKAKIDSKTGEIMMGYPSIEGDSDINVDVCSGGAVEVRSAQLHYMNYAHAFNSGGLTLVVMPKGDECYPSNAAMFVLHVEKDEMVLWAKNFSGELKYFLEHGGETRSGAAAKAAAKAT
jgi:hypothetical protein